MTNFFLIQDKRKQGRNETQYIFLAQAQVNMWYARAEFWDSME